jgi:hypothetical protein
MGVSQGAQRTVSGRRAGVGDEASPPGGVSAEAGGPAVAGSLGVTTTVEDPLPPLPLLSLLLLLPPPPPPPQALSTAARASATASRRGLPAGRAVVSKDVMCTVASFREPAS